MNRRPRGVPRAGLPAGIGFYILGCGVPDIAAMLYVVFIHAQPQFFVSCLPYLIAAQCVIILPFGIVLYRGNLVVLRVFRFLCFGLEVMEAVIVIASILCIFLSPSGMYRIIGIVALVFSVLMSPLAFFMHRALTRVRWLDPKSLPSEWEPPISA